MLSQLQHGPVALAAGGTVEAVWSIVVDPLVVAEVPGQAEGLAAQVAHVALLTVDSHVVTQGHVVGVGLAAEVTPERERDSVGEKLRSCTWEVTASLLVYLII